MNYKLSFFKQALRLTLIAFLVFSGISLSSCSDAKELLDLALDSPDRQPIDKTRMGVNNFFIHPELGSIEQQFLEIRDTLGLSHVRVLFAWTNDVQATPDTTPNYTFYDRIVNAIPAGMDVIIVLAHAPDWMLDSSNWSTAANPRATWAESWVRPTVTRYKDSPRITGYEIFNEPDLLVLPGDAALSLETPENYYELVTFASPIIRSVDPARLVIMAATEAINQNFPENLNYNKQLKELGIEALIDIWNVHYYSENFERVVTSGNIGDFLNGLSKIVWITESGENGINEQLQYVETAWPFLREKIPGIDRIYYYDYGSPDPVDVTFSLKTFDPTAPVSNLYVHLRDG